MLENDESVLSDNDISKRTKMIIAIIYIPKKKQYIRVRVNIY